MEAGLPVSLSRCEGNVKHRQDSMHSLFFFFVSVKTPSACKKSHFVFRKVHILILEYFYCLQPYRCQVLRLAGSVWKHKRYILEVQSKFALLTQK